MGKVTNVISMILRRTLWRHALLAVSAVAGCAAASPSVDADGRSPVFWVYHDGVFAWPGDYSYVATPDYRDTSGVPLSGKYDVKVTVTSQWGGWQPFATNWDFDTKPYKYLRFALKPTRPNQTAQVYFMLVGDKPVGKTVDVFKYGPAPVVGQWNLYTIPLADIGVSKTNIYIFAIQDQTGLANNIFYVDDVAFVGDVASP